VPGSSNPLRRRAVLASSGAVAVGTSGCSATDSRTDSGADPTVAETATSPETDRLPEGVSVLQDSLSEATVRDRIASADPEQAFLIEPGAQWTLTDTLRQPTLTTIRGFNLGRFDHPTFLKGFDGTLLEVESNCAMAGVAFDGNKAEGFGGDVCETAGNGRIVDLRWDNVMLRNAAGDAMRVSDTMYGSIFRQCRWNEADGWGIRLEPADAHHTRNVWSDSCVIDHCGAGGIKWEFEARYSRLYAEVGRNGGPGIQFEGYMAAMAFDGNFVQNDGPALLQRGGRGSVSIAGQINANARDAAGLDLTSPVGQVHCEAARGNTDLRMPQVAVMGSGHPDGSFLSNQSAHPLNVVIAGGRNNSSDSMDGEELYVQVLNGGNWNGLEYNCSGQLLDQRRSSLRHLQGSEFFVGVRDGPPRGANGSTAVYLDSGTGTDDGSPGWRFSSDGGASWSDLY
jgi:hypothetical protein